MQDQWHRIPTSCAFLILMVSFCSTCRAQSAAPVIFYSDIDSGPRTGGEGGRDGAFICLYGEHFGSKRGSSAIIVGGAQAVAYKLWNDPGEPYKPAHYAKACAQISQSTPLGNTNVELVSARGKSNALPFVVRSGKVYFVSPKGSDRSGDGSSEQPWQTVKKCKGRMSAGDVCYLNDGVKVVANENYGAAIALTSSGEPGRPKALVAYPGATVIVNNGTTTGSVRALTNFDRIGEISYWTIAGMTFDSSHVSVQLWQGKSIRLVDNDILCTGDHCYGYDAGLVGGGPGITLSNITVVGNRIHDVGCHEDMDYRLTAHPCSWVPTGKTTISTSGLDWKISRWTSSFGPGYVIGANGELRRIASCDTGCRSGKLDRPFETDLPAGTNWKFRFPSPPKFFHNVYFGNANSVNFGWNDIDGKQGQACRGLLFHSTAGFDEHDLSVHDNVIHDTVCDCLAFATVDPSQGPVEAYNNTLHTCGTGSAMVMQSSYAGLYVSNDADSLPNPTRHGIVHAYNNTVFDAGGGGTSGNNTSCFAMRVLTSPTHGSAGMELTNDVCVQTGSNGQSYYTASGADQVGSHPLSYYLSGSHDNCFGAGGACPLELSDSLAVAPSFQDAHRANFRLNSNSKLRNGGAPSKAATDQDGEPRGSKPNIGAF